MASQSSRTVMIRHRAAGSDNEMLLFCVFLRCGTVQKSGECIGGEVVAWLGRARESPAVSSRWCFRPSTGSRVTEGTKGH